MIQPPDELASERLILRAYRADDAALYFRMVRENWDHLYEFLPEQVRSMQSEADAGDVLGWLEGERRKGSLYIFGLWEKDSGRYVGETYLANPDWHVPSIELGYFLVRAATGRAFDHLRVRRVDLQVRADNTASRRVAERLGFCLEGCQRLRHRKQDGVLVDRLWYGLLREEWEASRAAGAAPQP